MNILRDSLWKMTEKIMVNFKTDIGKFWTKIRDRSRGHLAASLIPITASIEIHDCNRLFTQFHTGYMCIFISDRFMGKAAQICKDVCHNCWGL